MERRLGEEIQHQGISVTTGTFHQVKRQCVMKPPVDMEKAAAEVLLVRVAFVRLFDSRPMP
jgi:hypothetical protein